MNYIKDDMKREGVPVHMTSVIEWTRYDGTPETLPEARKWVLLSTDKGVKMAFVEDNDGAIFEHYLPRYSWQISHGSSWTQKEVETGDIWADRPIAPDA